MWDDEKLVALEIARDSIQETINELAWKLGGEHTKEFKYSIELILNDLVDWQ